MEKSPTLPKVTVWHMLRDIFVTAINRGQLLAAGLLLILLVIFIRLPAESLKSEFGLIIKSLIDGSLLGYALFLLALGAWYAHAKKLRSASFKEQKRIGNEKTALQKRAGLGDKAKSSKNR